MSWPYVSFDETEGTPGKTALSMLGFSRTMADGWGEKWFCEASGTKVSIDYGADVKCGPWCSVTDYFGNLTPVGRELAEALVTRLREIEEAGR